MTNFTKTELQIDREYKMKFLKGHLYTSERKELVIDILKKARNLLEPGIVKGTYYQEIDGETHYCMVGAIDEVANDGPFSLLGCAKTAVRLVLPTMSIPNYNDRPTIKTHHVLKKIDKAIELVESL